LVTIRPVVDEGLGNSSYIVDLGDDRALVVDPTRDVSSYERYADQHGLDLAYSLETHLHADFVSGSRELAAHGATVLAPRAGASEFPHRALDEGVGGHGERAATAASLLERAGGAPSVFLGSARDWSRAVGRPLTSWA